MASDSTAPNKTTHTAISLPPLEEQLGLFAGTDDWHFRGSPTLGYPELQVADCGHGITLVAPPYGSATCFPTSVGMGATWNRKLIKRVGEALGRETRAKKCGMLLGPMVNLHRIPNGGRNFETFSEDPVLTGKLAASLISGIQGEGAGACIKAFACNNQQFAQHATSVEIDDRTLREIYLKSFVIAFEESDPWCIMTCYNPLNGIHPGDSHHWITTVLREELGYEGMVLSDWRALQSQDSVLSGVDIEMPGPGKFLCAENLKIALAEGRIDEEEINRRARRVLKLHEQCTPGRLNDPRFSEPEIDSPRHRELCREVAEEAIVLLKNEGKLLPLDRKQLKRIAVIGPNATSARLGGGGSASVSPFYSVSPLEGIRNLVGEDIEILSAEGCALGNTRPAIPTEFLAPPDGEFGQGLSGAYYDLAAFKADAASSWQCIDPVLDFSWGWASPANGLPREHYAIRWQGRLRLPSAGQYLLALSTQEGIGRAWVNGKLVIDAWTAYDPTNFEDKYTNRNGDCLLDFDEGDEAELVIEYLKTGTRGGLHLGWKRPGQHDGIEAAEKLAREVDAVILVGGLSNVYEGGNCDRKEFKLPGRQEELIRRVGAANSNTVVVLKNATPVALASWIDNVPALLEAFYPGQEGGNAIAKIIFGEVNPSGKLPDTMPNSWEEVPAMQNYPGANNQVHYKEELMVGYRHYDAAQVTPAYPFGFGLSYTTFAYASPSMNGELLRTGQELELSVSVTNTGAVQGKESVQLYLEFVNCPADRPPRQLLDFAKLDLAPGASESVTFKVRYQDLLTYNVDKSAWELEFEDFRLCVGPHSRELQKLDFKAKA